MYWFPETDKEQPKFVNPGEEIPFKESLFKVFFFVNSEIFFHWSRNFNFLKGVHVVSFRAIGPTRNYEIPKIKLGAVGITHRDRFVCDISSKDGTKTILLRTVWTLHNATLSSIEVKIIPSDKDSETIVTLGTRFFFFFMSEL